MSLLVNEHDGLEMIRHDDPFIQKDARADLGCSQPFAFDNPTRMGQMNHTVLNMAKQMASMLDNQ